MNRRGFIASLAALLGVGAVVPRALAADPYMCTCGCGLPRGVHDMGRVPDRGEDPPGLPDDTEVITTLSCTCERHVMRDYRGSVHAIRRGDDDPDCPFHGFDSVMVAHRVFVVSRRDQSIMARDVDSGIWWTDTPAILESLNHEEYAALRPYLLGKP